MLFLGIMNKVCGRKNSYYLRGYRFFLVDENKSNICKFINSSDM